MGHSLSNATAKKQTVTQAVIFGLGLFALLFLVLKFVNGFSYGRSLYLWSNSHIGGYHLGNSKPLSEEIVVSGFKSRTTNSTLDWH
ncbi:hypothetical protein [Capnocytophaga gingivalis]|uniref:Uncharacterized protein n=1 Tax=Capnocytophaga gingivalis TaxID=1017 RepID=A0ABU5Y900_9FLAO|nr:hypothetical protein [Capnocytophaga gingivalis]MEB3040414.1 hypothetical protein [Capnocytophaga gingivalis]